MRGLLRHVMQTEKRLWEQGFGAIRRSPSLQSALIQAKQSSNESLQLTCDPHAKATQRASIRCFQILIGSLVCSNASQVPWQLHWKPWQLVLDIYFLHLRFPNALVEGLTPCAQVIDAGDKLLTEPWERCVRCHCLQISTLTQLSCRAQSFCSLFFQGNHLSSV